MASRTQMRLAQLTGSIGTASGQINDQTAAAATGSIASGDLSTVLSHVASAIQRVHGELSFTQNAAGEFNHTISPSADNAGALGTASKKWADLFLANGGVVNFNNGNYTLTHSDDQLLVAANKSLAFGDAGENIKGNGTDLLISSSADINLMAAADVNIPAAVGLTFGNDGEKIEGDGTDLTIASSNNLDITVANKSTFDFQGTDNGDGLEVHLGTDNANSSFHVKDNTGNSAFKVDGTKAVTIGGTLDIVGDVTLDSNLTVNGTTVTVNTANLTVDDPIVVLAHSSSVGNTNGGIAIMSGSNTAHNAMVFGRVAQDVWGVGRKDIEDGAITHMTDMTLIGIRASSIQLGAAEESITGNGTDITFAVGANGDINIPANIGLTFGNDGEIIEGNGTRLAIKSGTGMILDSEGDIILDADGADIFLDDGGTRFGQISMIAGNSILALSSSAGNNLALMSQAGSVLLSNQDGSVAATFNLAQTNEVRILDSTDRERIRLDSASGDGVTTISGSFKLNNGADAGEVIFKDATTNTLTLDVPDAVTTYSLTLPAAKGATGQVLSLADGNGNLQFSDASGDLSRFSAKITAGIGADSTVKFRSGDTTTGVSILKGTTLNVTKTTPELDKSLEVFVNGQLLMSGAANGDDTDYTFINSGSLRFEFGLETGDIVQVIQR